MDIELFCFDWSGVISDDRMPVYESNMRILESYGIPRMEFDEWLRQTTMTPVEFFRKFGIDDEQGYLFSLYKKHLEEVISSGIVPKPYPDAKDVLSFLKREGKMLTVVSSHPKENLVKEAEEYGILELFDAVDGSSSDKKENLERMLTAFAVDKRRFLYCGDTVYDIRAAKEVGVLSGAMRTGYHTGKRLSRENPDFLFHSLSEIKDILR